MEYVYYVIGQNIESARKNKGLTQPKLIEKLSEKNEKTISRNTLSKIERGDSSAYHTFRFDTLAAFSEILGCDIGHLIGEYQQRTRELADICDVTGYNADVIEFMTNLPPDQKEILSEILLHKSFLEILARINELKSDIFSNIQEGFFIRQRFMHELNEDSETLSHYLNLADCEFYMINKCFSDIVSDISKQQDTD